MKQVLEVDETFEKHKQNYKKALMLKGAKRNEKYCINHSKGWKYIH